MTLPAPERAKQRVVHFGLHRGLLLITGLMLPLGQLKAQSDLAMDLRTWPAGEQPSNPANVGQPNGPDGLNDLWQIVFDAWELDPDADEDGDGASNGQESSAGTDPHSSADFLTVRGLTSVGEEVVFSFDTKAGKRYRVLSNSSPGGTFTTVVPLATTPATQEYVAVASATGSTLAIAKPTSSAIFFRIEASDVDSNNDGVSDWVARQLGYDPSAPSVDLDGDGTSDLKEDLVSQLSAPDEVEVVATAPFASEDGPESGSFEVRRTRRLFSASVNLSYSGTASAAGDYSASPSATVVNFARGEYQKTIFVNPNAAEPTLLEGNESVTVTLSNPQSPQPGGTPAIGQRSSATVILRDSTAPEGSGLLARYYDHASTIQDHGANFGDLANYTYTLGSPNTTGTILVTPTTGNLANLLAAITPGSTQVRLSFNGGNLNNVAYNHQMYLVTAKTGTNFTCAISSAAALPGNSSSNLNFSIDPVHPPVIERVDATVDYEWMGGTPNGNFISPLNDPDNWSSVWEAYLHPTTASTSGYRFQLDADDKARVLIDLNRNGSFELPEEQVVEHGWDAPGTLGTFNISNSHLLAVPANASERYKIRVEHVETTGEARCRLQWSVNGATFANIPQGNVYGHVEAMNANYSYTRTNATAGAMAGTILVTLNGHGLSVGSPVRLSFSSGNLFTPANGNFHGTYTVSVVNSTNTFTVPIAAATLPASGTGAGFVLDRPTSTTQAWYNVVHQNVDFSGAPGRIGTNNNGSNDSNNGFYGTGSPNTALIGSDTFSIRWTGQVQPQFTEEYTFSVLADDGFRLWINGQERSMTQLASGNVGGSTYTYNSTTGEAVVNYAGSSIVADSYSVGDIVRIDPTAGTLSSLATTDLVVTSATPTTFTVVFPTGMGDQAAAASANLDAHNRTIKPWGSNGSERFCRIPMVGGVRYDIRLDYYESGGFSRCRLFWFSPSQPKQIIPTTRLYPSTEPGAPSTHVTQSDATALIGGFFRLPVAGSNGATVAFSGLPEWLSYANGELTGTPPAGAAGLYQILVTLTNAAGTSQSVVNLEVKDTGGEITRELWTGVTGDTMADYPTGAPTSTETLPSLESPTDAGDNYATRLRGFLTAPETGNYYFWVAGSNAAELWISNDAESVNAFRRARVVAGSATPRTWTIEAGQKSPWMALEQGKRYYIEVRHKAGTGPGDNLAVGWSRPGEPTSAPSEVVPGHVLSPWSEPVVPDDGGTIWSATLRPQSGAVTNASGSSFLRLNAAETEAIITANYSGLTSAFFGMHVHNDMIPGGGTANIIADLEEPGDVQLLSDGTYRWVIKPTAGFSVAELVQHLKDGKLYFNVHSVNFPPGEIKGHYSKLEGAPAFVPPADPPAWTDDSNTDAGAARFLAQATFGASPADITTLKAITPSGGKGRYELWIEDQFSKPASETLSEVLRTRRADAQGGSAYDETLLFNSWWRNSVSGSDQLRQRIAFALSQIQVVSAQGPLDNRGEALAYFYDQFNAGAFGNFRDILETTTLTPTMGRYLDMLRNDKPDLSVGRSPNENYAREIQQLFSIGLFRMWPDGTLILNSRFEPIDTYSQREIVGFAHVFTGWDYGYDGGYRTSIGATADWLRQMREVPARHFTGPKRILNNEVLPGLDKVGTRNLDPYATHGSMEYSNADFQTLPARELDAAHDQLFENPNTGPFICRQLIQRMVTSHPSRGYVYRVTSKFNDNGEGVRGDMQAVIKAILLDYEARGTDLFTEPGYGKQREPLLRLTAAGRAFRPAAFGGSYAQTGTRTITVDTSMPHNLASGNNVFLDFTSGDANGAPWTGTYAVASVPTTTQFTVNAVNWATGTYNIPANSNVCTVTMSNHWLQSGHQVFMDFTSGAADGSAAIDRRPYTLTSASAESGTNITFTFTVGDTSTSVRSGNCMIPRFSPGSYTVAASGLPAPNDRRVTMRTNEDHHLAVGDQVQLNIFGGNPQPADRVATVESVVDLKTWTFLVSSAVSGYGANQGNNSVYQFPLLSQPVNRTGTINSRSSTYQLGNTDANLEQSPLNADTVFNFFFPDYKFPGELAGAGLTTPEFQITSETTTVRQANFIFNGVFNPGTTNGYSSFSSGNNSLVMDYSPWMTGNAVDRGLGNPTNAGVPWTHNQNVALLVDHFATLFTANQMDASAKQIVRDFVSLPIASIGTGNPCVVNTVRPHGYATGQTVYISGVTGGTFSPAGAFGSNSTGRLITVVDADTFTVTGVSCTAAPSGAQVANAHVSQVVYDQGNANPSATHRRDRIRSILHLILTSPDFSVQR